MRTQLDVRVPFGISQTAVDHNPLHTASTSAGPFVMDISVSVVALNNFLLSTEEKGF